MQNFAEKWPRSSKRITGLFCVVIAIAAAAETGCDANGVIASDGAREGGAGEGGAGDGGAVDGAGLVDADARPADDATIGIPDDAGATVLDAMVGACPSGGEDPASGPLRIFPGAQGFGIDGTAGRGGRIIHVTNLDDSGDGSLRAAVTASGPRTIVFDVSGAIRLRSPLRISEPHCTIAGQSAPGDGIMLRDYGVAIRTHNILLQHFAIRPGDEGGGPYDTLDGLQITGSSSYNIVADHLSISWGIDENADTWTDVHDVTFSNCIISEGLRDSLHSEGSRSMGYLAGRRNQHIALVNNLLAHNASRNPIIYGETRIAVVGNVFYNAGRTSFTSIGDGWGDGPPLVSVAGNVYLNGPNTTATAAIKVESSCPSGTRVYSASNFYDGGSVVTGRTEYVVSTPPVSLDGFDVRSDREAILSHVLERVGARPTQRDAVDRRLADPVTGEVATGTGRWVDCVSGCANDAGGWPGYRTTSRVFDPGPDPLGDDDGDGYTNVEEILAGMARELEGC
jgi:hypothetical protein